MLAAVLSSSPGWLPTSQSTSSRSRSAQLLFTDLDASDRDTICYMERYSDRKHAYCPTLPSCSKDQLSNARAHFEKHGRSEGRTFGCAQESPETESPGSGESRLSSSVAVLVVGLVRGTSSGNHLQELATFLDSFPGGRPDVFGVLELNPQAESDTGDCSSANVERRLREYMRPTVLQLLDADEREEQVRAVGREVPALYQFWKTSLAMDRLIEHERHVRHGVPYKLSCACELTAASTASTPPNGFPRSWAPCRAAGRLPRRTLRGPRGATKLGLLGEQPCMWVTSSPTGT